MIHSSSTLVADSNLLEKNNQAEQEITSDILTQEESLLYGNLAFILKEIKNGNIHSEKIKRAIEENDESLKHILYLLAYGENKSKDHSEFLENLPTLGSNEEIRQYAKIVIDNYLTKLEQKEIRDSYSMDNYDNLNITKDQAKVLYYSKASEIRYNNFELTMEDAEWLMIYLGIIEYDSSTAFLGAGGNILNYGPICIEEYFPFENEEEKEYAIGILKSSQRKEKTTEQ
ncbi:MAG: hypothetical protein V3575_02960 [Candidatus Absconditabacteria bacterium]